MADKDEEQKKKERVAHIKSLCREAIERYQPESDGTTYCNMGVNFVALGIEYTKFAKKLANEMVRIMLSNPEWAEVDHIAAKKLADDGRLVVAGKQADPHGHVCVVYPNRNLAYSRKWNKKVPMVANVGKHNGIMGCNFAFKDMPKFYVLIEDV